MDQPKPGGAVDQGEQPAVQDNLLGSGQCTNILKETISFEAEIGLTPWDVRYEVGQCQTSFFDACILDSWPVDPVYKCRFTSCRIKVFFEAKNYFKPRH